MSASTSLTINHSSTRRFHLQNCCFFIFFHTTWPKTLETVVCKKKNTEEQQFQKNGQLQIFLYNVWWENWLKLLSCICMSLCIALVPHDWITAEEKLGVRTATRWRLNIRYNSYTQKKSPKHNNVNKATEKMMTYLQLRVTMNWWHKQHGARKVKKKTGKRKPNWTQVQQIRGGVNNHRSWKDTMGAFKWKAVEVCNNRKCLDIK